MLLSLGCESGIGRRLAVQHLDFRDAFAAPELLGRLERCILVTGVREKWKHDVHAVGSPFEAICAADGRDSAAFGIDRARFELDLILPCTKVALDPSVPARATGCELQPRDLC